MDSHSHRISYLLYFSTALIETLPLSIQHNMDGYICQNVPCDKTCSMNLNSGADMLLDGEYFHI